MLDSQPLSQPVINAQGVGKIYKEGKIQVEVLCGLDLTVSRGEQVAIIGASGSGKSTLLHLLGGLDRHTCGKIFIEGEDISGLSQKKLSEMRNHRLGFIYQLHHLLPEFTVIENVAIPLLLRGMAILQAKEQAAAMLTKVGLQERLMHKVGELSGGERQRTAIARALVTEPACILADEPTGNLDQTTAEKVYETMLELNRDYQTSLVIVTHDMSLAKRMDRVLHLEDKQLIEV